MYLHVGHYLQSQKQPLVFTLLTSKTTLTHQKMIEIILKKKWKLLTSKWKKLIVTDFERAIIRAIEIDFPEWTRKVFYRNVLQLGMVKKIPKKFNGEIFFRNFMVLASVPENEVLPCILKLISDPQTVFLVQQFPKIADVLKYLNQKWLLTFQISMWNVLDQEPILMTTNGCEAWNST